MFLSLSFPGLAQDREHAADSLTLEDIYVNDTYRERGYGPVRWMQDGPGDPGYTTLEANAAYGGQDIVRYEAGSGKRSVLVPAGQLIPEGAEHPLQITDYHWSEDHSRLLLFTDTRKVWRYHTRGDYWVLDLPSKRLRQLGRTVKRRTLMFAKFSPDASRVVYVSERNIYVEELATGSITQLTRDGGDHIINGTFDWVYEEELDCRDGFRWSPDGTHIAYWQSDTRGTGTFYLINNVDSVYSQVQPLPYPKVGTTLSAVKVGVIPAEGGATRWFEVPGNPREHYLARMDFIPGSDEVIIQQLNRLQNTNRVWTGDIRTMRLTNIMTDRDDAFLNVYDHMHWLKGQQAFIWTSERDGWRHLYKVSRDGKETDLITKGAFDVVDMLGMDPAEEYVYYIASPENYTQRYLYRSRLDGKEEAERVSPAGMPGQHAYQMSPDAKWAVHIFRKAGTPSRIALVSLPEHKEVKVLEDNAGLKARLDKLDLPEKEFLKVDIGDVVLDAWMIRPAGFDPGKQYPLLFYVYGEPAASTVQDAWGREDLWHQYLAQQGYVVMSVDNRGTNVPRGRDWRKSIYRQVGILAAEDQRQAALKLCSRFPFIDRERIGIWGWSGGGSMTLNALFRYPGLYKTGIAVAFVADQRLYDATYQERYMGLPEDNAAGYREGSPITHASGLEGNLLIIHGTGDDNVHYQSFEMLVNALVKHNKLFNMMTYPMRSHSISERENTSLHLRRTMERFLKENL